MQTGKQTSFACERCRIGKRKCDSAKPQCSLCRKQNRACVYSEPRVRKRKYWDEDYVRALENQVQSLLAVQNKHGLNQSSPPAKVSMQQDPRIGYEVADQDQEQELIPNDESTGCHNDLPPPEPAILDRSQQAMEELSVMMWRTNVGDGVTIINDDSTGSHYRLEPEACPTSNIKAHPNSAVLAYSQDQRLMQELVVLFLENINDYHQFTTYDSADFLQGYPYQDIHLTFLHSAIIAAGATFSDRANALEIGDTFTQFAESLIFTCCRNDPTVAVIQGLCMLSWKSLAQGRDHFGWMFISMAAGICVHLRLHVLALDEFAARSWQPNTLDIRTFWMFYIVDRSAISILGRNCVLPWRRVNVPDFDTTFEKRADLTQISFAWQCKMWYLHDQKMDQVFSSTFETLPVTQQVHLLVSTHEALNVFFRSRDRRLDIVGDATPKCVLLFHMAYQMAILITMPPFLRLFTSANAAELGDSNVMFLILRTLTYSAAAMARHGRTYRQVHSYKTANPIIIHHLLSAAIVHLMNATSNSVSLKKQSTRWLRLCLDLLADLATPWPVRANKSIKVIRVLAQRWGVTAALPLKYSYRVEPSENHQSPDYQQQTGDAERSAFSGSDLHVNLVPDDIRYQGLTDESIDFEGVDMDSFAPLATLDTTQLASNFGNTTQASSSNWLQNFEGLNNCDDFNWPFNNFPT